MNPTRLSVHGDEVNYCMLPPRLLIVYTKAIPHLFTESRVASWDHYPLAQLEVEVLMYCLRCPPYTVILIVPTIPSAVALLVCVAADGVD